MNPHTRALLQDRVLARSCDMLELLRIQVSCYQPDALDVLKVLERPQQYDVAVEVTRFLMAKLGFAQEEAKEPRFDKLHRKMVKRRGRPPRGLKAAGEPTAADALEPTNAT